MQNLTYHHSSKDMYELADESVHLVITKPRFPMFKKWDDYYPELNFDVQHEFLKKTWKECYRILVEGGICCVLMSDITRSINKRFECFPNCAKTTMQCRDLGFTNLVPIVSRKSEFTQTPFFGSGFLPPNAYVRQEIGNILIFRKGGLRKFVKSEKGNREQSAFSKDERNIWFQQIWWIINEHAKLNDISKEIVYRLIRMYSVIDDLVVDPFSEKESVVGHLSVDLNRKFIGYFSEEKKGKSTLLFNTKF